MSTPQRLKEPAAGELVNTMTATHKTAIAAHAKKDQRTNLVDGTTMADALAISTRGLHRLRAKGRIGHYRVGRCIRYQPAEVMEDLRVFHVTPRLTSRL